MAKKPRVKHEPRSAHGRAVKKKKPVQSKNRARPMAARLIKQSKNKLNKIMYLLGHLDGYVDRCIGRYIDRYSIDSRPT